MGHESNVCCVRIPKRTYAYKRTECSGLHFQHSARKTSLPSSLCHTPNSQPCLLCPHPLLSLFQVQSDRRAECLLIFLGDSDAICDSIHSERHSWPSRTHALWSTSARRIQIGYPLSRRRRSCGPVRCRARLKMTLKVPQRSLHLALT